MEHTQIDSFDDSAIDQIYERHRQKVHQENELVHQRMMWFVTLQSFLFTSLALFSNGNFFRELTSWVFYGFSTIGAFSALLTLISVTSAYNSMRETRDKWQESFRGRAENSEIYPALMGGIEGLDKRIKSRRFSLAKQGRILGRVLPFVVLIFWIMISILSYIASIGIGEDSRDFSFEFVVQTEPDRR